MKKLFTIILISFSFELYAQLNTANNLSEDDIFIAPAKTAITTGTYKNKNTTGITCNPNTFWATNSSGQIEEFQLSGNVVTSNGIVVSQAIPGYSLAFSNNLNGSFSPTFYSEVTPGNHPYFYDGSNWTGDTAASTCPPLNAGGNGNYLYYLYNGSPNCIERYDGISFTQIYADSTLKFASADIAIDDAGNIWSFMGAIPTVAEYIIVFDPNGQIIKQYPFNLNTNCAYGCFLLNGILYLGFCSGNTVYPNTLLPITLTTDSAITGTPINFTAPSPDLASCSPGNPLAIAQNNLPGYYFLVYPNIAADYITCDIHVSNNSHIDISIIGALGKLVYSESQNAKGFKFQTKINVSHFSKGIYFVELTNACLPDRQGKQKAVRKFIKE